MVADGWQVASDRAAVRFTTALPKTRSNKVMRRTSARSPRAMTRATCRVSKTPPP